MQAARRPLSTRLAPMLALALACPGAAATLRGSTPGSSPSAPSAADRQALEELLARARERQLAAQAQLTGQLEALLATIAANEPTPSAAQWSGFVDQLVALGPEATPLLVAKLEAPEGATEFERYRALHVSRALARMDLSAVTRELLAKTESANLDTQRLAIEVLANSSDAEHVRPALLERFERCDATLKPHCLRALIQIGGPGVDELLGTVLAGPDENLIAQAIDGLAEGRIAQAVERVRGLLQQPQPAARHVNSLLRYFQALPSLATSSDIAAFVRVATTSSVQVDTRVAVLDALPAFRPSLNTELRRAMEPLVGSPDRKLHEAALVLMTRLGDKSARRELLREYDERVAKNENWSAVYVQRGDLYARIEDDDEAIKDYRRALQIGRSEPSLQTDTKVKLARALVRRGKLKDAGETLRNAAISLAQLHALADDPEFRPLRESKYGKDAFGLD